MIVGRRGGYKSRARWNVAAYPVQMALKATRSILCAVVLFLAMFCAAQVPTCATTCASGVATNVGCGNINNTACICNNPNFPTQGGECISVQCLPMDLPRASAFFSGLCAASVALLRAHRGLQV
ncbi:hypothetical protein OF83DRAFT_409494 [Amylostereum chailletii]|nr:hypothetical protein OF83DRAFT_409494 [Amylostereum chailletii]